MATPLHQTDFRDMNHPKQSLPKRSNGKWDFPLPSKK